MALLIIVTMFCSLINTVKSDSTTTPYDSREPIGFDGNVISNRFIFFIYIFYFEYTYNPAKRCIVWFRVKSSRSFQVMSHSLGAGASCLLLGPPGFNGVSQFERAFSKLLGAQVSPSSISLLAGRICEWIVHFLIKA